MRLLHSFLLWLMMLALPVQGFAAASMLYCGTDSSHHAVQMQPMPESHHEAGASTQMHHTMGLVHRPMCMTMSACPVTTPNKPRTQPPNCPMPRTSAAFAPPAAISLLLQTFASPSLQVLLLQRSILNLWFKPTLRLRVFSTNLPVPDAPATWS